MRRKTAFQITGIVSLSLLTGVLSQAIGTSQQSTEPANKPKEAIQRFPVHTRSPGPSPAIETGFTTGSGEPVTADCSTCHATRTNAVPVRSAAELESFHLGLNFEHGQLVCASCHDPGNNEELRLADGTHTPWANAMQLCAQCHGPQARDYENGSHGGMTGYWDTTLGPRTRNSCVQCHDPHSPAFPQMYPAPPPRDRHISIRSQNASDHNERHSE